MDESYGIDSFLRHLVNQPSFYVEQESSADQQQLFETGTVDPVCLKEQVINTSVKLKCNCKEWNENLEIEEQAHALISLIEVDDRE